MQDPGGGAPKPRLRATTVRARPAGLLSRLGLPVVAGVAIGWLAIHWLGPEHPVGAVLLNMAVFGAVLSYGLQMASYVLLRRRLPAVERPYQSPLGIPGAVVALNAIGARRGRSLASLHRTLSEVFTNVDGLATNPDGEITNVIFYATDGSLELTWVFEPEADELRISFGQGQVLRDALNPFNYWNAPWSRMIRANRAKRY